MCYKLKESSSIKCYRSSRAVRVVSVRHRRQAPSTQQEGALVVHHELVDLGSGTHVQEEILILRQFKLVAKAGITTRRACPVHYNFCL